MAVRSTPIARKTGSVASNRRVFGLRWHFFTLSCSLAPADRSGSWASACSICPSHSLGNLRDPAISVVTAGWSPGLLTPERGDGTRIATESRPAGTPEAAGVQRHWPRENGQWVGGGEWGGTDCF